MLVLDGWSLQVLCCGACSVKGLCEGLHLGLVLSILCGPHVVYGTNERMNECMNG